MIELIILAISIPAGILLAWMTKDELLQGRKWFKIIIIASAVLASQFYLAGFYTVTLTLTFIFIASFISLIKSYDKEWTHI